MKHFVLFFMISTSAQALDLSSYRWKNRVILVEGEFKSKEFKTAMERLHLADEELHKRDVIVLQKSSETFSISLFGKDGGKKWKRGEDFNVSEIVTLIDSMPMRKSELRK